MATSLKESDKEVRIEKNSHNIPAKDRENRSSNPEIIWLKLKKKTLTQAKYIALMASMLSGLNKTSPI